jgi:hypothetical protein
MRRPSARMETARHDGRHRADGQKTSDMEPNHVTPPAENTRQFARADAPLTRLERAARAIRLSIDVLSLALFVYCQLDGVDGVFSIVVSLMVG